MRHAHVLDSVVAREGDRHPIDRDTELLDALRRRETTAAERLFVRFRDRAYGLAFGITGNQQDAEEAVQDTFWSVVRNIDRFRGDAALGSWIYRIAANAAYQKRRRGARRRTEISLDEIPPSFHDHGHRAASFIDSSTEGDDPAVQTELRSVLTSALEELPAHYRTVIILHEVEGLSLADVAASQDITVPTTKARAHRARRLLRQRLGEFMAEGTPRVAAGA